VDLPANRALDLSALFGEAPDVGLAAVGAGAVVADQAEVLRMLLVEGG